jgi:hypothetical protein
MSKTTDVYVLAHYFFYSQHFNKLKYVWVSNLVPEDVHNQREDGDQLEEDEAAAKHGQHVVQVEVVQEVLK